MSTTFTAVSIDFESTGLSVFNERVTQIGVVIEIITLDDSGTISAVHPLPSFKSLVDPQLDGEISDIVTRITGLTMEMLRGQDKLAKAMTRLQQHLNAVCPEDSPRILMAYNGNNFDIPLLVCDCERNMGREATTKLFRCLRVTHSVDLLPFAREFFDSSLLPRSASGQASFKLGGVYAAAVGHELVDAHDALADSQATIDVLKNSPELLVQLYKELNESDFDDAKNLQNLMQLVKKTQERVDARTSTAEIKSNDIMAQVNAYISSRINVEGIKKKKKRKMSKMPSFRLLYQSERIHRPVGDVAERDETKDCQVDTNDSAKKTLGQNENIPTVEIPN